MNTAIDVVVVVITWLACGAFTWGVMTERLKSLASRVSALEQEKFITRHEYEARHKELSEMIRKGR